ncbi:MAG: tRNA (guanosine(46)-N7)-methyltransferase TrmB [Lachnospiraceae bacterium]|nr:tRNA (guanosine(46)-N7)-methyltransferase TrmB [Clostridiales bacterium]MCC8142387.1 tRNA (guanosine(46)-N7)-methyltransferase TrmB [Lachnospiraceae bacterium]
MRLRNIPGAQETVAAHELCYDGGEKPLAGTWSEIFGNDHPIYLEIGMGKGKFLTTLAELHPERNYVGIEMFDSVLVRALQKVDGREDPLYNIRFLRMNAEDLCSMFAPGEVAHIYLNFSDPWPKDRHAKRRLTSTRYLERYDNVLAPDGQIEFKTDNRELFGFSLEQAEEAGWDLVACTCDLHYDDTMNEGNVMTEYEERFTREGKPIYKMIIER